MPILVDYSQIALASVFQFPNDFKNDADEAKIESLMRHVVLNSLLNYKKRFSNFGELIICCDGKKYWRKDLFPYYKAHRAKGRKASGLNWKLIFDTMSKFREELREVFPYRVIHDEYYEADDIIGVMTKYFQDNELDGGEGLYALSGGEPKPILILSSDSDNYQLHKYNNVKQYNPVTKKFVTRKKDEINKVLLEKICTGDSGDGIPNILSDDDTFVHENKRQKPFRKVRLDSFFKYGVDACENQNERRNFQRNEALISYEKIPQEIQEKIIDIYKQKEYNKSSNKIMNYFIKHRCKILMNHIEEF